MTTTQDRTTAATPSAFSLLLTFAKQRPRLDPRNYGDGIKGYRAYQTEARQIGKDLARVKLLAATAIAHGVTDAEIIEASKAAFSGRLEWTGSEWDYCTGSISRPSTARPSPQS